MRSSSPAGIRSTVDLQAAFGQLDFVGKTADIVVEGAYVRQDQRGGRAYLAVPAHLDVPFVLRFLNEAHLPLDLTLVHPTDD